MAEKLVKGAKENPYLPKGHDPKDFYYDMFINYKSMADGWNKLTRNQLKFKTSEFKNALDQDGVYSGKLFTSFEDKLKKALGEDLFEDMEHSARWENVHTIIGITLGLGKPTPSIKSGLVDGLSLNLAKAVVKKASKFTL